MANENNREEPASCLTVKQAAAVIGVSVGCMYRRWQGGKGPPYFHVGRARRVRREALMAWVKKGERNA